MTPAKVDRMPSIRKKNLKNKHFVVTLRWHTGVCDTRISCRYNHQSHLGGIHRVACCAILVENETQQVFTSPACWNRPAVPECRETRSRPSKHVSAKTTQKCHFRNLVVHSIA